MPGKEEWWHGRESHCTDVGAVFEEGHENSHNYVTRRWLCFCHILRKYFYNLLYIFLYFLYLCWKVGSSLAWVNMAYKYYCVFSIWSSPNDSLVLPDACWLCCWSSSWSISSRDTENPFLSFLNRAQYSHTINNCALSWGVDRKEELFSLTCW